MASYLTACVALIAVVIAAGQWHTARTKLVLDLSEKRLAIVDELLAAVRVVLVTGVAASNDVLKFGSLETRASLSLRF